MKNKNLFLIMFSALFTGFFVVSNFIAVKEMEILGFLVSASAIVYPFTFVISNIVSEKYDIKEARKIVFSGFIAMALIAAFVSITYLTPGSDAEMENAYQFIFGNNTLIVIASLITYLVSQIVNLVLYNNLPQIKYAKYFISSLIALFLDALIFKAILLYFGIIEGSIFYYVSNHHHTKYICNL
jgi:uncharacterized integral membrane protein (TIGR00697 family)